MKLEECSLRPVGFWYGISSLVGDQLFPDAKYVEWYVDMLHWNMKLDVWDHGWVVKKQQLGNRFKTP